MTKKYQPSNGTEGCGFMEVFCERCTKNRPNAKNGGCGRLCRAMAYDIDHEKYPSEWVVDDDGRNPRCTAFRDKSTIKRQRHNMKRHKQTNAATLF